MRVDDAWLRTKGNSDSGCAVLLDVLPPAAAEARLEEMFRANALEARPLIWQSVLQLREGRLDEAEKTVRRAIDIDPGEAADGRGSGRRAYAVLGDILERKGDAVGAARLRRLVKATVLSEEAEPLRVAGLTTRAVKMNEKALNECADVYEIQARLAIDLTSLGRFDEARPHYQRAYELMPASLSRTASFYLGGCEHIFTDARAQRIAESVFRKLADQQPNDPRVHYLRGFLLTEETQDAETEAAREFQEATRLDPNLLDAWWMLEWATPEGPERDQGTFNQFRLDPTQRHRWPQSSKVSDLRGLWLSVEESAKFARPVPVSVYPLAASKAFLEQQRQSGSSARGAREGKASSDSPQSTETDVWQGPYSGPASALLATDLLKETLKLLKVDWLD